MRYHLSLHVNDLDRSIAFYSKVFAAQPQKRTAGYAKFDLHQPPINLSLLSAKDRPATRVSHMGVEVDSAQSLESWRERLEGVGIVTSEEKNSTCCFARQDKLWFSDPDGNPWEIFVVYEQLPVPENAQGCGAGSGKAKIENSGAESAGNPPVGCC